MSEINPYSRRLRQKCDTIFSVDGPDGSTIVSKCGTDFLDSTRDFGSGIVFKRGLIKITKWGVRITCPKCHYTKKADDAVVNEIISVLAEYTKNGDLGE
jgi:hypothetical protein